MEVPLELQELILSASHWSNESWVNANEDCYGIEICNMSLRHLVLLDGIETPFLTGGNVSDADIALFLWILSVDYSRDEKKKKEFFKKAVKIKTLPAINWIKEYIKKTFIDSDTMNAGEKGQVYFISYFVDCFAREYGWKYEEIMDLPLRKTLSRCFPALLIMILQINLNLKYLV